MELANTAERPGALRAPLTRSIEGLPSLEHPAGRNLAKVSFKAPTCFSLITRKLEILAAPAFLRRLSHKISKLAMRHPAVVLGLTLNAHRCSLARATGPLSSHGCFCLVQRERPGKPSPKEAFFLSTFFSHRLTPRSNSNTPRAFYAGTCRAGKLPRAHGHEHIQVGE